MQKLFIRHCCLVIAMVCAAVLSARADDFRLRSNLRPDAARQTGVTDTDSHAMAFFCVLACAPDLFGLDRIADADVSLDLTDTRQMDILYSDLVGILIVPPSVAGSSPAQSVPPDGAPLSPVDAIIASRADHLAPASGLLH
jgi:hypothetical protein